MSLTTRLSTFFLAALAAVLVGFSFATHSLTGAQLRHRLDERVRSHLHALTASVEIEEGLLEWDPTERRLPFDSDPGEGLAWGVFDEHGRWVAGALPWRALLTAHRDRARDDGTDPETIVWEGEAWRLAGRTLRGDTVKSVARDPGAGKKTYPLLALLVAAPRGQTEGDLRALGLTLAGLSLGAWAVAALAGRAVCRWALAPLTRMAGAARSMGGDLGRCLPVSATGDELEDLGRAFNDLLGRARDAYERQRRFTGEASHQLRTPLAGLLGQIEVALRHERAPEEYRRVLRAAHTQSDRLRRIVEMLLFLARADAEAGSLERSAVDPVAWLADHLATWEGHPRRADVRLEGPPRAEARVGVHPALLGQALDNLLDNACKYSAPGTPVTVRIEECLTEVAIVVEDQGAGIAPADLSRVGQPFFRADAARRAGVGGVGLGCAVAARIAGAFGGRLDVQSSPGRGSRFAIRLPRQRDAPPAGGPIEASAGSVAWFIPGPFG